METKRESQEQLDNTSTQGVNSADENAKQNWAIDVEENPGDPEEYFFCLT